MNERTSVVEGSAGPVGFARLQGRRRERRSTADEHDVGQRLRVMRTQRGMTLSELARRSGLTRGFLTQVEGGKVSPSVASLQRIVSALGITLGTLFSPPLEHDPVVRRGARRILRYPESGVVDELLSPSLSGKLEILLTRVAPGGGSGEEPYSHDADEECVIVLKGRLSISVNGESYDLAEGDAITFCSRLPHAWRNPSPEETECLWVITPPGF